MRRFAADRARRAVAASLRGAASSRSAAPSPLSPAPRYPAPPVGAAAMAAALARTMSTAAAGTPPVSMNTINPKVPLLRHLFDSLGLFGFGFGGRLAVM